MWTDLWLYLHHHHHDHLYIEKKSLTAAGVSRAAFECGNCSPSEPRLKRIFIHFFLLSSFLWHIVEVGRMLKIFLLCCELEPVREPCERKL